MKDTSSQNMPLETEAVSLPNGEKIEFQRFRYPIASPLRMRLIDLIQRQWAHTDLDWLQTMRGQWADTLVIEAVVASLNGKDMGTAQVAYARIAPEANIIMDVMVIPEARGKGIGSIMTDWLQARAFDAGSRVAYLGNRPGPSVYERIGFKRLGGVFMRKPAKPEENPEEEFFKTDQHINKIRPAVPGDLPGIVCLNAQPLKTTMIHYEQSIVSRRYARPGRAVSSFGSLWYSVEASKGALIAAEGAHPHRILGYGTLTPGPNPCRACWADLDFVSHDRFPGISPELVKRLLSEAKNKNVRGVSSTVCELDTEKREILETFGFKELCVLPPVIQCGDQRLGAVQMIYE